MSRRHSPGKGFHSLPMPPFVISPEPDISRLHFRIRAETPTVFLIWIGCVSLYQSQLPQKDISLRRG